MSDLLANEEDVLLAFDDETQSDEGRAPRRPWRVLIVDDDEDVHTATLFALDNVLILGRRLEFIHAYNSEDARNLLAREKGIAVILLDVVMEREDAGLLLVHHIREELKLSEVRIILRTGQPGYAPEIEAIRDYDINDYKTKSELTRSKLFTTLTSSMRSYDQICAINAGRRGLDMIVRGSAQLIGMHGLKEFAAGVITQLAGLLGTHPEGVVCAQESIDAEGRPVYQVIAAAGRFANQINAPIDGLPDTVVRDSLRDSLATQLNHFGDQSTTLFFASSSGRDMSVYLATEKAVEAIDRQLIEVFCSNISVCLDNIALVARLRSQAYFDPLVLLPNRVNFIESIDGLLTSSNIEDLAVILIDIDHFAEINDALGHKYGDRLLQAASLRLRQQLSPDVVLARVAGDAFGIFGPEAAIQPQQILGVFSTPFDIDGIAQNISVTLGITRLSEVEGSGVEAIKAASIALKRAKQEQRGSFAYFTRDLGVRIRDRVKLLQDLRGAFACERLFLHYQPQVRLEDAKVIGLEALIRWRNDEGRYVPPDHFIPLAEHSGLIVPIGEWVMRTACQEQRRLAEEGYNGIRMAINVSVVQFRHPKFLDVLDAALADSGVNPSSIELEITESVAMLEADYMIEMLNAIRQRGLQVAIDDFGTGFSSLSYLQQLSIDRLKIDRSFVNQMSDQKNGKSIAAMVVDLGKNLGLQVIAEGVEDEEQADRLRALGCHEAQGYYYARPMDEASLREWLKKN